MIVSTVAGWQGGRVAPCGGECSSAVKEDCKAYLGIARTTVFRLFFSLEARRLLLWHLSPMDWQGIYRRPSIDGIKDRELGGDSLARLMLLAGECRV